MIFLSSPMNLLSLDPTQPQGQFWIGVISLLVALISLALSVWFYLRGKQKKVLSYEVLSNASIVNVVKDFGERITVTLDDGEEVQDARILVIQLTHIGNAPIDVNEIFKLRFEFEPESVLRCGIQATNPVGLIDEDDWQHALSIDQAQQRYVELTPLMLNPRDSITMKILIRRRIPLRVTGRITGGSIVEARPMQRFWTRRRLLAGGGLFIAGLLLAQAISPISAFVRGDCAPGSISAGGSSAFADTARAAAKDYQVTCPVATITIQDDSSGKGLSDLKENKIQIANSELPVSRANQAAQIDLDANAIGIIPFVLIVNASVEKVDNLTKDQLRGLYDGSITNWNKVGGPDLKVQVVGRASQSSGTRTAFEQHVIGVNVVLRRDILEVDTTGQVQDTVAKTKGAIGYVDLKTAQDNVSAAKIKLLKMNNAEPTLDSIKNDAYSFWAVEYMYTRKDPGALVKSFISYVQKRVKDEKFYLNYDAINPDVLEKHR
ncbi:hypothetical protein KDA_42100 [Dictyobacter alpinus]|uniref:PBP domain-containing protein n=1 Tax=Dictyobacter alpinus TaxID=2014873 RepID=A0A402BBN2_9CHLR|nr:substrate-binding domain-containing protein [Dictyobacter alpinus]GCE28726.1 hypothetical protein KDA_42100 [Dictyobacter alpinus]